MYLGFGTPPKGPDSTGEQHVSGASTQNKTGHISLTHTHFLNFLLFNQQSTIKLRRILNIFYTIDYIQNLYSIMYDIYLNSWFKLNIINIIFVFCFRREFHRISTYSNTLGQAGL